MLTEGDRVSGVETNLGVMGCETFVNCGGFWARHIGQMSDPVVKVPLHPVEHYYLHTKPIEGLDPSTPGMYFLRFYAYFCREHFLSENPITNKNFSKASFFEVQVLVVENKYFSFRPCVRSSGIFALR